MKVILLADVKSVGKKGETVTVADGYGRNVLLAKKLGVEATAQNMNKLKFFKFSLTFGMVSCIIVKDFKLKDFK